MCIDMYLPAELKMTENVRKVIICWRSVLSSRGAEDGAAAGEEHKEAPAHAGSSSSGDGGDS